MAEHQNPSPEAERRWQAEDARFRRRFNVTALIIAAAIVLTYVCARFDVRVAAILCVMAALGGLVRTIYLVVARRRTFLKIIMDDGMTRSEAVREDFLRHGG
jgi:hypothetical protein